MKKYLFVLFTLLPLLSYSQKNKHIILGIDMDSDWFALTNQSSFVYSVQELDSTSDYVTVGCDYIHDKIDPQFLNFGFDELLFVFPKGYIRKLDSISPQIFIARINYTNNGVYQSRSNNDISKVLYFLKNKFGEPELNMIKDKFKVYKWNSIYFDAVLTCREEELTTAFYYFKK